ncbi:MAG: SUMF1/EgtB/PvdO family nonheme iron enzyme [Candidatus Accumulibacter sp.]|uniref:SUMF1/EgtB/PvdO family nonheme iron enzyme n=1 Tax=Accumulibacter sp. TaxID=2053492 RepID=UPI0025EAF924|nr:SUMF1/EgtB/PvdO family nonheme iron enzyme [Accumulibacter sp.]MCM8599308.1 SUMF1/EgtB/PvdO family nonheme iron enzyme [Accumulibacter sp.]
MSELARLRPMRSATAAEREAVAGDQRVLRGGSWNNNGRNVRSANRNYNEPGERNNNIGFRLAPALGSKRTARDQTTFLSVRFGRRKANALRQAGRRDAERLPKRRSPGRP